MAVMQFCQKESPQMNWLMFKDGDAATLESWNKSATACLRKVSSDVDEVKLILPAAGDAESAYKNNVDLMGSLCVSFKRGDQQTFKTPLPYHGVFVAHGGDAENKDAPQRLVWSSWLGEMPGLRKVRVANGEEALRLGMPDGQFILVDEKRLSRFDLNEIAFVRWWAKAFPGAYDEGLLRVLAKYEKVLEDAKAARADFCEDVRDWAEKHEGRLKKLDADDLGYEHIMARVFMDFHHPAFQIDRRLSDERSRHHIALMERGCRRSADATARQPGVTGTAIVWLDGDCAGLRDAP